MGLPYRAAGSEPVLGPFAHCGLRPKEFPPWLPTSGNTQVFWHRQKDGC
jgi:hypothetical protein